MTRFLTCAAAAAFVTVTSHSASAEPPACGAPTAIEPLRQQVVDHYKSSMEPSGNSPLDAISGAMHRIYFPDGKFDIKVDQMFAVSRAEDVRECRASMHLVEPGRVSGDSAVYYSVVRSEDGHDLVAIKGEDALYQNLLRSLEENNPKMHEAMNNWRRDLLRSGNAESSATIRGIMRANPNFNKPAPSYGPSVFRKHSTEGRATPQTQDGDN